MHIIVFILLAANLFLPVPSEAAVSVTPPTDLKSFLDLLTGIIDIIITIIIALTFIAISWGVMRAWIMGDASAEDVANGKKIALVGVIVLTLMLSIWGVLRLLQASIF